MYDCSELRRLRGEGGDVECAFVGAAALRPERRGEPMMSGSGDLVEIVGWDGGTPDRVSQHRMG